jgi:hypothetical protein
MKKAVVQRLDLSGERWSTTPELWHLVPDGWQRKGSLLPIEFNTLPTDDAAWRTICNNAVAQTGADLALFVIPGMDDGTRPERQTQIDLSPLAQ